MGVATAVFRNRVGHDRVRAASPALAATSDGASAREGR
jgi:hypothetical protein